MRIGVLAVQGAFIEHEKVLQNMGIDTFEIRNTKDLFLNMDGIILPGGESTVMGKLLRELEMLEILRKKILSGLPVLATCAGLILLAEKIEDSESSYLATLPITVKRNAYGRQLGSFETEGVIKDIGKVPMKFIRAPYISNTSSGVDVIGEVDGKMIAVQYQNQIALSFHPELTGNNEIHNYFLNMIDDSFKR